MFPCRSTFWLVVFSARVSKRASVHTYRPSQDRVACFVFPRVGVAGGQWHLYSKISTLMVLVLHLAHATTQLDFVLVLEN